MNIIVTGSLAYDRIMDFPDRFKNHILPDKIHMLNVCFVVENLAEQFGGTAGNIAYNLKFLGLKAIIVSAAGKDFTRYAEYLKDLGISSDYIKIFSEKHTAVATMMTDLDDNQITAFYPGALALGAQVEIPPALASHDTLLIIAPSSKSEIAKRAFWAKEHKVPYIFDPGQQITALSPEELALGAQNSRLAIFNDYEWELFKNKTRIELTGLTKSGIVVIVTSGHEGSIIYTKEREYSIGAAQASEVLDPTGAGDAYRAGIVAGIVNDWDWQTTGQLAATISSFAVEKHGTQIHQPTIGQIKARYIKNFDNAFPL